MTHYTKQAFVPLHKRCQHLIRVLIGGALVVLSLASLGAQLPSQDPGHNDDAELAGAKFSVLNRASYSLAGAKSRPDVFWLDKYGNIAWEEEKARLDNFAIQLMNDPNLVGYYYVMVGKESCRGEGQARAIRAKNYMTRMRHVDWARIIWRDIGYGDDFQVSIWLSQRGKAPMYVPEYHRATAHHVVQNCGVNPLGRQKLNSGAANKRTVG